MPTEQKDPTTKAEKQATARLLREAEALRANLKRRKAQSRARKTQAPGKVPE
jgi:hypothetical protein